MLCNWVGNFSQKILKDNLSIPRVLRSISKTKSAKKWFLHCSTPSFESTHFTIFLSAEIENMRCSKLVYFYYTTAGLWKSRLLQASSLYPGFKPIQDAMPCQSVTKFVNSMKKFYDRSLLYVKFTCQSHTHANLGFMISDWLSKLCLKEGDKMETFSHY